MMGAPKNCLLLDGSRHRAQIPTYSGGLGVLAGDTIRAAADLNVPMVAVTPAAP